MKILISGGTIFLGRHLVEAARARGHELTLFNRGESNPELVPDIEKIRGDRETDLKNIGDLCFDAVIDTCAYVPRVVDESVTFFASRADRYTFISSVSVFADVPESGVDEAARPV